MSGFARLAPTAVTDTVLLNGLPAIGVDIDGALVAAISVVVDEGRRGAGRRRAGTNVRRTGPGS